MRGRCIWGQLEVALATTNNPASNNRDEDWIEQLGAVREEINNEEFENAIQEFEDKMEQDQDYNKRVK
jgi:lysophospholipase L1-like esterase